MSKCYANCLPKGSLANSLRQICHLRPSPDLASLASSTSLACPAWPGALGRSARALSACARGLLARLDAPRRVVCTRAPSAPCLHALILASHDMLAVEANRALHPLLSTRLAVPSYSPSPCGRRDWFFFVRARPLHLACRHSVARMTRWQERTFTVRCATLDGADWHVIFLRAFARGVYIFLSGKQRKAPQNAATPHAVSPCRR